MKMSKLKENKKVKNINGSLQKKTAVGIERNSLVLESDKKSKIENYNEKIDQDVSSPYLFEVGDDDEVDDQFHSAPATPTQMSFKFFSVKDVCVESQLPLHKCIFLNDHDELKTMLEKNAISLSEKDKHGNTPLHLAVMLGRKECIKLLLTHNAVVKIKNNEGWTVLAEAISYGDRDTISSLLKKLRQQSRTHLESRRETMIRGLNQIKDFYMELKWDFTSWVPLVSRMLPSDVCRIHKCGSSLRLDTTLVDFNDMRWERGDTSFIFRGDKPINHSITVLDNEFQCYKHLHYEDSDIEDEVDILMSNDILAAHMSTKSIQFSRAQSGWIFREDRKEVVGGQYLSELYTISGLVLKQRKRREHLSQDDIQKNKAMLATMSHGRRTSLTNSNSSSADISSTNISGKIPRRSSLPPPPKSFITWEQYINADAGKCPSLGRTPVHKQSNKSLKATVAMSKEFPLTVDMLLNILEVIGPFKHISKLREFIALKLPPGFPVKVEIPVLHTVTAKITFQKFEFCNNISPSLFEIPEHYVEDSNRFPDL